MIRWRTNIEYEAGQYPWIALLDVFFILLVFFLISNSVVFWPGTKLETALSLPTASSAKLQEADKLIVTITRSGRCVSISFVTGLALMMEHSLKIVQSSENQEAILGSLNPFENHASISLRRTLT